MMSEHQSLVENYDFFIDGESTVNNGEQDWARHQYTYQKLTEIDKHFQETVEDRSEFRALLEPNQAAAILSTLGVCNLENLSFGLDYALEQRRLDLLIREDSFPHFFRFLIAIAGDKHALDRENHDGMGYHFHYVKLKKAKRTDVMFTFDRRFNLQNSNGTSEPLFWEYHGNGIHADPNAFGLQRRRAIYHASMPSLLKPGKATFRLPSTTAQRFYP